jgi:hypothetical protein
VEETCAAEAKPAGGGKRRSSFRRVSNVFGEEAIGDLRAACP